MTQITERSPFWFKKLSHRLFSGFSPKEQSLYQRLNIIFGFFFLVPTFGLLYFLITYDLLEDKYIPHFFAGFLICSLSGFITLRVVFEKISRMSDNVTRNLKNEFESNGIRKGIDEIENISKSLSIFEKKLSSTVTQLSRKATEISTLKELSDLCYVTFDTEELLYITLDKALKIANADIGSILILEDTPKRRFVVKATIGQQQDTLNIGDTIDFQSSIAKYAVINKAPFVVENIEADPRIGRLNKSQYASKSFVCMPIKTIRNIIGVLTLSRKKATAIFSPKEVEGLIPLISNAAFTYENLRLLHTFETKEKNDTVMAQLIHTVNSSLKNQELYQALLKGSRQIIPFQAALLMRNSHPGDTTITVMDFYTNQKSRIQRGKAHPCRDAVLERLLIQGDVIVIEDLDKELTAQVDKTLLAGHGGNAAILLPLVNTGKVAGCAAFIFETAKEVRTYQELTRMAANIFSMALEKTTLSLFAMQRATELETIRQIGSVLASSTFNIQRVLTFTMDMIRVSMKVEAGALLLIEEGCLKVKTAFNMDLENSIDFSIRLGHGISGYVAAKGDCVIENDVQHSALHLPAIDQVTGFTTRSALCVPMISQGRVIGVIEVLNKVGDNFAADDQQLLQAIASSVSIAIENARLYKETQSRAEKELAIRQIFQKFVPEEVVQKIVHDGAAGQHMEELKTITLLNIDLRNFSTLSNTIGPQKTVFVLNHFFSVMGEIIFSHRGIVDKYLGDGFLALFGTPIATTADADHAVSAAVEMKKALVDINAYLKEKVNITLHVGISIHTGEVVVGNIGFDKKMDYTVIGDA